MQGFFLSFEGVDGSGKSTQARMLAETLRGRGHEVVLTREPGGSPGAEEIRRLVLEGEPDRWSAETEILLFTAARRDHLEKTIRPALGRGAVVICDRFADSTRIFQGITRGDLTETVDRLHGLMIGTEPDLTLLIDIDPEIGLSRAVARRGSEQDMARRVERRRAELRAVVLVVAPAGFLVRFRQTDVGLDERAHGGFVFRLPTAFAILHGRRGYPASRRFLPQQFADDEGARRRLPGHDRRRRGMVRGFPRDLAARDGEPVHADRAWTMVELRRLEIAGRRGGGLRFHDPHSAGLRLRRERTT